MLCAGACSKRFPGAAIVTLAVWQCVTESVHNLNVWQCQLANANANFISGRQSRIFRKFVKGTVAVALSGNGKRLHCGSLQ
jgi:hypothetical protein